MATVKICTMLPVPATNVTTQIFLADVDTRISQFVITNPEDTMGDVSIFISSNATPPLKPILPYTLLKKNTAVVANTLLGLIIPEGGALWARSSAGSISLTVVGDS